MSNEIPLPVSLLDMFEISQIIDPASVLDSADEICEIYSAVLNQSTLVEICRVTHDTQQLYVADVSMLDDYVHDVRVEFDAVRMCSYLFDEQTMRAFVQALPF